MFYAWKKNLFSRSWIFSYLTFFFFFLFQEKHCSLGLVWVNVKLQLKERFPICWQLLQCRTAAQTLSMIFQNLSRQIMKVWHMPWEEAAFSLVSAQSFGQVIWLSWSSMNLSGKASEKKALAENELLEVCCVSLRSKLSEREFLRALRCSPACQRPCLMRQKKSHVYLQSQEKLR